LEAKILSKSREEWFSEGGKTVEGERNGERMVNQFRGTNQRNNNF
jgi:hypothetical protein